MQQGNKEVGALNVEEAIPLNSAQLPETIEPTSDSTQFTEELDKLNTILHKVKLHFKRVKGIMIKQCSKVVSIFRETRNHYPLGAPRVKPPLLCNSLQITQEPALGKSGATNSTQKANPLLSLARGIELGPPLWKSQTQTTRPPRRSSYGNVQGSVKQKKRRQGIASHFIEVKSNLK
ncbi:hypothetical protein H5410_063416 [Solanum commersonii]|uniref:Uncharacterized protein n=1 Tax=Solanum commersonii TaxID=4109 RepID=A0A9J5WDG0_SOLCO|nr:hypothetical protein H5410_063416 [Solanum commersonii]